MSEEPQPGEWHEGYWYEWEWVSAKGVTPYDGFWQVEVPMRIFPWGDGYSISVADTGLPARPVTFREAEEVAVAADAEALALAAEVERLRRALQEIAHQDHIEIALDPDWPRRIARAALRCIERGEGE